MHVRFHIALLPEQDIRTFAFRDASYLVPFSRHAQDVGCLGSVSRSTCPDSKLGVGPKATMGPLYLGIKSRGSQPQATLVEPEIATQGLLGNAVPRCCLRLILLCTRWITVKQQAIKCSIVIKCLIPTSYWIDWFNISSGGRSAITSFRPPRFACTRPERAAIGENNSRLGVSSLQPCHRS